MIKRILYIKKKAKTKMWSDVLDRQFEDFKIISSDNCDLFEVDTANLLTFFLSVKQLFKIRNNYDIIYVNHIICGITCIPSISFSNKKWILALHESEPVLGIKYAIKNRKALRLKELFRYSFLMKIPLPFFRNILILNDQQKQFNSKKYKQFNFLGVNTSRFYPQKKKVKKNKLLFFFPHNPKRPEKGYNFVKENWIHSCSSELVVGGQIPYNKMADSYNLADATIFSGDYETYSIAFLESAACNNYIISNNELGIIKNLRKIYSLEELKALGIFIYNSKEEFTLFLTTVSKLIEAKNISNSIKIITENKLDEYCTNIRLYEELIGL